jgi:hypothetical protein
VRFRVFVKTRVCFLPNSDLDYDIVKIEKWLYFDNFGTVFKRVILFDAIVVLNSLLLS